MQKPGFHFGVAIVQEGSQDASGVKRKHGVDAAQAFGAAAQSPLSIRPLPFEEWARGAAAVSIQSLVVP